MIYTKKGDKGTTSLYDPENRSARIVSKDSQIIQAIGSIDELNSFLGVVISVDDRNITAKYLRDIQSDLFVVGSILGGSRLKFYRSKIKKLERIIDQIEQYLPPLKNFIYPRGNQLSSYLHYTRAVCRRVERIVVGLSGVSKVYLNILAYLNRLSDLLFVLSRKVNYELGLKEEIWKVK